jgi:FkbM family methyltransferase
MTKLTQAMISSSFFLLLVALALGQKIGQYVHEVHTQTDVSTPNTAYLVDHWGKVDFAPVPAFDINTHDPVHQDVFISGSVHFGTKPWDSFVWDRLIQLSSVKHHNDTLFVDVGANIGFFSLAMASLGHHVFAFEPMSRNARKLVQSTLQNHLESRLRIMQNAVSDSSGQLVSLKETDVTNQGNGQIVKHLARIAGSYGVQYVHTLSLSDVLLFVPGHCINAYIIKIDVEGHEAAVIKGARSWLRSCRVDHVIIEFSETTRINREFPARDMFKFMRKAGYTARDVNVAEPSVLLNMDMLVAGEFELAPPNILFSLVRYGSVIPDRN